MIKILLFSFITLGSVFLGCSADQGSRKPSSDSTSAIKWEIEPKIQSSGSDFQVDAAATLNSPLENILEKAVAYDKYVAEDVPTVKDSRVISSLPATGGGSVSAAGGDMIVWFHTAVDGQNAEYYVKVHVAKDPNVNTEALITWSLTPKQPDWNEPDNRALSKLSGSWELKSDPADLHNTKVTYHLEFQPNTSVPSFVLHHILNSVFIQEATALFELTAQ